MIANKIEEILQSQQQQYQRLNEIVEKAIEEEKTLSNKLLEFEDSKPAFNQVMADKVASFGGSWKFILVFVGFMGIWILVNLLEKGSSFDPYPFILLNLILSTIAALQAPVIMMSQNRKEEKDRQRAINDYLINLKAEIEVRNLHRKLDLLMNEQMKVLFQIQNTQMELIDEVSQQVSNLTSDKATNRA